MNSNDGRADRIGVHFVALVTKYRAGAVVSLMRFGSDSAGGRRINATALMRDLLSRSLRFTADMPVSPYRDPGGKAVVRYALRGRKRCARTVAVEGCSPWSSRCIPCKMEARHNLLRVTSLPRRGCREKEDGSPKHSRCTLGISAKKKR